MPVEVGPERRIAVAGRGVQAPLQRVARDEPRAGNDAIALTLTLGADVDQHRTIGHRLQRLMRPEPAEPAPGAVEQLVDRRAGRALRHRQAHSATWRVGDAPAPA